MSSTWIHGVIYSAASGLISPSHPAPCSADGVPVASETSDYSRSGSQGFAFDDRLDAPGAAIPTLVLEDDAAKCRLLCAARKAAKVGVEGDELRRRREPAPRVRAAPFRDGRPRREQVWWQGVDGELSDAAITREALLMTGAPKGCDRCERQWAPATLLDQPRQLLLVATRP